VTPRVLVVRSGSAGAFPAPASDAGFMLTDKVTHEIVPVRADPSALPERGDLAVFTSQVAVRRLFDDPSLATPFRRAMQGGRIAAVGEATGDALRERGVEPDLVAGGSGRSVLDRLPARLDGWHVILPRGADATEELPEGLEHRGAVLCPLVLYRKLPLPPDPDLDARIAAGEFSAFCATSPASAQWLFGTASGAAKARLAGTPAVVLGRFTGRYLGSHGIAQVEVARQPNFGSLLERLGELALAGAPPPA